MDSWIMKLWLETHNRGKYPDLSITQGIEAFHVLPENCRPPVESIMRMCSRGFFTQHEYNYVERPINIRQGQTLDKVIYDSIAPSSDLGHNENAIPEEVHQEDKNAVENSLVKESVNTKYPSLTIHYKTPAVIPNEKGYKSPIEHRPNQAELNEKEGTQSFQSRKTKLQQDQKGRDEVIYDSIAPNSDLGHNENAVPEEVPKHDQKEVKNALVKDSVNTKYPSLTIHYKTPTVTPKHTDVPKERENQRPTEHSGYETGLTERGQTENCITISSRDSQEELEDAKVNLEDQEEIEYCDEDASRVSGKDTPVTHIHCTDKIKEKDHAGQNLQQAGEGTESSVHHQFSPLRRRPAIRRKTKCSETKKQTTREAKILENKENVTPEYDSQEVVQEHVLKEVNEPHRAEGQNLSDEIPTCLPQVARREEQSSMLQILFPEIEMDCTYDI